MSATRRMYEEVFEKNAVKLKCASNKSVGQVAKDLGISDGMLYRWRAKYTPEGDKSNNQLRFTIGKNPVKQPRDRIDPDSKR